MLILALDTTTRGGSVALARDAAVIDQDSGDPAITHGRRLPGEIQRLLARQGLALPDVELYAVAAGPGSFTGLRVGIATIQGLAFANQRLVVPVGSVEALAYSLLRRPDQRLDEGDLIAAWMDAQRGEVFASLYRYAGGVNTASERAGERARLAEPGRLQVIDPVRVASPLDVLDRWADYLDGAPATFVGDGASRYRAEIVKRAPASWRVLQDQDPVPLAATIALLASSRAADAVAPHAIHPIYVRRPDAELVRDRAVRQGS